MVAVRKILNQASTSTKPNRLRKCENSVLIKERKHKSGLSYKKKFFHLLTDWNEILRKKVVHHWNRKKLIYEQLNDIKMPYYYHGNEEEGRLCEGRKCSELLPQHRHIATKICHHSDCQALNNMNPLLLCPECDEQNHQEVDFISHLRFDLPSSTTTPINLHRKTSMKSNHSDDSGTEEDSDASYRFDKKNRSYSSARRFFNISANKNKGRLKKLQSFDQQQESPEDCFTLQLYDQDENLLAAESVSVKKGRTLKEAIGPLLENYNVNLDTHSIFLESSKTPLRLDFITAPLAGNTLHVKATKKMQVDERIVKLMQNVDEPKQPSQRQKKTIMSIMSNDDSQTQIKTASLPASNARLTKKGGSSKDLSKSLPDLLQQYSMKGFEGSSSINLSDNLDGSEASLVSNDDVEEDLEEKWTDVIDGPEDMTRSQKNQQEAIWELLSTEYKYVGKIRVILQVFRECLFSLQRDNFLREVDSERLFSNIQEIYNTNRIFWSEYLRHVVAETKRTREPIKPSQLLDSFARFEDLFDPYIKYCLEESHCVAYLKQLKETNENFNEYLLWCENQSECHRLKLADLLVKPMQRVTKYALLLKAVLQRTIDTDEILSLENMISQVDRFVSKINTTLRLRHEEQKLKTVLNRLENYCPIEATEEVDKVIQDYCNLDLHQKVPGLPEDEQRCILLDGSMKMIEKQGRLDVQVFLFTDILLITKAKKNGEKFRIIRPPYRLNKVVIYPSSQFGSFILIYLNEYGVLVNAFTLQVQNTELTKWMQAIERAKRRYQAARSGHGSTLDFIDDDLPFSNLSVPSAYTPSMSPLPMRTMNNSISDENGLLPPIVVKDEDLPLRSSSSSNFTSSVRGREESSDPTDASVQRSLSDPKTSVHPRSRDKRMAKTTKARPYSMIQTSERDQVSSWVFNDKRNRSGSIPSDISDDSRRSSGIGDSFRSINSDTGPQIHRDGKSSSYTEMQSVQKLKKRFETGGEYHSDSSSSLASSTQNDPTKPVSRSNSNKRSNPDFTEQQHTIHEEEEQPNKTRVQLDDSESEAEIDEEEDEEIFRSEEGDTTRTLNGETVPLREIPIVIESCTQTEACEEPYSELYNDTTFSCEKCSSRTTKEQYSSNTDLVSTIDAETSFEIDISDKIEIGVQCGEKKTLTRSVSSQCGDFVQLTGVCEEETDTDTLRRNNKLFYTADETDGVRSHTLPTPNQTPMMDALTQSLPEYSMNNLKNESPRGILKSLSDANIPSLLRDGQAPQGDVRVIHNRSQSDEPRKGQSSGSSPKHSTVEESPGMRALMALSENLEELNQQRTSSAGSKPKTSVQQQNSASPSLRKTAIVNSSPQLKPKTFESVDDEKQVILRSNSSITPSQSWSSSPKQMTKSLSEQNMYTHKRNTWHESMFQHNKNSSADRTISPVLEEDPKSGMERTFSKSTEQLNSPRKQKSFKKTLLKKFSDARLIEREQPQQVASSDDHVTSSVSDTSMDSKQMKKQMEKEKKEEKKRLKMEKKLEKKEKKYSKRRSGSHTSLTSSITSLPTNNVTVQS